MNLIRLSAKDQIQLITSAQISTRYLTESYIKHIQRIEEQIHAWECFNPKQALSQADTFDKKLQDKNFMPGALAGIPIGVKDIFNTKDLPTQMGSPIWKGFTPGNDARVVYSLRQADAIIPGKTVTAEFAVHTPGPTHNPHKHGFMTGTSSSGSAAAVASYMVPLALGTQTAGSTIRPASYCGVYGFKPSFGLIPRTGMLKTTDSLDSVGFFSRTVDDLKLLFNVLRVRGFDYPISHKFLSDPKRQNKPASRKWRVAIVQGPKWNYAEDYAKKALYDFSDGLNKLPDISLQEIQLSKNFSLAHDIHSTIYDKTLAYYFKEEFKKQTLISKIMYQIISHGNKISLEEYRKALERQDKLSDELDSIFKKDYDIILNLSTGGEAMEGLDTNDRPDNCLMWTLCGVPVMNLPIFKGPKNLPFGAQIVARRYNDYLLISFAQFLRRKGVIWDGTYPFPEIVKNQNASKTL